VNKELLSRLYSTEPEIRKEAVYRILFDRLHEMIPELRQAAFYEKDEEIALLIAQTCLTLEAFPRDHSLERKILELLQKDSGLSEMSKKMWDYLASHGSSKMLIAVMGAMAETTPTNALDFLEACLNHVDPEIRAMACSIAINSGRPTHFAYVLNLVTDPDPMVSESAFRVVRDLPSAQMNIILDYALGSPDEWVLQNVAPFLPLLINNDLRKVISKVQYHQHPLVSKKAREALKHLDSIPFVSKRLREKKQAEDAAKNEAKQSDKSGEKTEQSSEDFVSFKEQMEEKRRQKMEEEKKKREEQEKISAEISATSEDEIADFADSLEDFQEEMVATSGEEIEPEAEEDKALIENIDFENEQSVLEEIDSEVDLDQVAATLESVSVDSDSLDLDTDADGRALAEKIDVDKAGVESEKAEGPAVAHVEKDLVPDFEEISQEIVSPEASEPKTPSGHQAEPASSTVNEPEPQPETQLQKTSEAQDEPEQDIADIETEEVEIEVIDQTPDLEPSETVQPAESLEKTDQVTLKPAEEAKTTPPQVVEKAAKKAATVEEKIPEDAITLPPIPAAQTIISRFPSFLADPFANLFKPARADIHLKNIQLVSSNLIAYLNLCFLQSCMFFAPPSEVLERSIKECLKGHLIGPTALRCLHNFSLAMKQSRENPVFFTFSLANILSESSDVNPVMMLRELNEYLKNPIEPLEETLPQAVEGLADILRGVKSILNNLIVMRAPKGAKEPFADLSGPIAQILPPDKRPGIELPHGEVVVLSRDGTEAFGLFPYFKYAKRKVFFNKPAPEEYEILLERLEIDLG
jgi:hypothetical protein